MKKLILPLSCLVVLAWGVLLVAVILLCGCDHLSKHTTKSIVIDFLYADWCGACHKQQQLLPLLETYAAERGYVINVFQHNIDTEDGKRRFKKTGEKAIPVLVYHIRSDISKFSGICHTVKEFESLLQ